jgi:WD40 repeat protein
VLPHDRPVLGVRFVQRADDKHLLMTRSDKRVVFWSDPQTFDSRPHADVVTDASPSADGELLVSASADGTAQLWSSRAASALALLRGHTNEVTRAVFGPDGRSVLTISRDRTLRRWRLVRPVMLAAGRSRQLAAALDPRNPRAVLCGEPTASPLADGPRPCRISPLADLATRGSSDGEWLTLPEDSDVVRAGFSADGNRVLGVSRSRNVDGTTRPVLWDATSRQPLAPAWLADWAWAAFAPGRAELVTLRPPAAPGAPEELAVWPQAALNQDSPGTPLLTLKLADGHVSAAALSADGRWLAAARADHVLLWDRSAPGAAPRALRGHAGDLRDLVFSADSRVLATASSDRSVRLWSMADPAAAPVLLQGGHAGAVTSVAFSPDGRQVLSGSTDGSIRLWDAGSGRELAAVQRHADAVTAVQFGADGRALLSASTDGTARYDRCEACSLPGDALQARAREAVALAGPPSAADTAALAPPSWLPRWLGGR